MRYAVLVVLAVLLAVPASAQTAITVTTAGPAQDNLLDAHRTAVNATTCESVSLPKTCTQAQARAKDSSLNVYSDVPDFYQRYVHKQEVAAAKAAKAQREAGDLCKWWLAPSTTQASKDSICTTIGLAAGCDICQ